MRPTSTTGLSSWESPRHRKRFLTGWENADPISAGLTRHLVLRQRTAAGYSRPVYRSSSDGGAAAADLNPSPSSLIRSTRSSCRVSVRVRVSRMAFARS